MLLKRKNTTATSLRQPESVTSIVMAATNSARECGNCHEEFNEESRCPRILKCFHTLCTKCIEQLIRKKVKKCPYCGGDFKANSANNVAINEAALELIKYFSCQKSGSKVTQKSQVNSSKKRLSDLKRETKKTTSEYHVICNEIQKQAENNVKELINLQKSVIEECNRIENDVRPGIQAYASALDSIVVDLEDVKIMCLYQLKELKKEVKLLEGVKETLEYCTGNSFKEIGTILDKAEEYNINCVKSLERISELLVKKLQLMATSKEKLLTMVETNTIIIEVLRSGGKLPEVNPVLNISSVTNEDVDLPKLIPVPVELLREMIDPVRRGKVYTYQHYKGKRRCGRVSITQDNKLCIHHLTEKALYSGTLVFNHSEVMKLVDPSSRLVFLELGVDESTLGRLYIRLSPDTKRAKHFALLCIGEMRGSYANSRLISVREKGQEMESVQFGDYDGLGGKAVLPYDDDDVSRDSSQPCLAGSVIGLSSSALFDIRMRFAKSGGGDTAFGIVEEGLPILAKAISQYHDISKVSIQDCGIVLPW